MIMEVAIALQNAPDDPGGERMKEGDIIALRLPALSVGQAEGKLFLWLRLDALIERSQFDLLTDMVREPGPVTGVIFDKRRYCIPLARIQILYPAFNLTRARDPDDLYQPFLYVDPEDYKYTTTSQNVAKRQRSLDEQRSLDASVWLLGPKIMGVPVRSRAANIIVAVVAISGACLVFWFAK